jgi:hypothetical protein
MNRFPYLLFFGFVTFVIGCAIRPSSRLAGAAVIDAHHVHHSTRVYRFESGIAIQMASVEKDAAGLNHVTIVGCVERAGAYYFNGKLKIETLITAARPIKTDIGCGSAYLSRITITSSKRFADRDSFSINYSKYLAMEGTPDRLPIELEGGEVVYVPEQL